MSREARLTFQSEREKELIGFYAQSRGHTAVSGLLRIALHEYMRRHKPADGTGLRQRIDEFLGENKSV